VAPIPQVALPPSATAIQVAQVPAQAPTADPTQAATPAPTVASTSQTAAPSQAATLAPNAEVQVGAYDNFFRPEKITITVGTKVTWTNLGQKDHTVTYGTLFDNDLLVGNTFSFTFDKPGTYQYYCVTHSESDTDGMVGTITVVAP
jgi:plastocyanin